MWVPPVPRLWGPGLAELPSPPHVIADTVPGAGSKTYFKFRFPEPWGFVSLHGSGTAKMHDLPTPSLCSKIFA